MAGPGGGSAAVYAALAHRAAEVAANTPAVVPASPVPAPRSPPNFLAPFAGAVAAPVVPGPPVVVAFAPGPPNMINTGQLPGPSFPKGSS